MGQTIINDGESVSPGNTIVATWGGESSNSYVMLTEATSFLSNSVIDPSKWSSATTAQKTAAALEATRDIDAHTYLGERYYLTQKLEFPRAFHSYPENFTQLSSGQWSTEQAILMDDVKKATCHQALWLLRQAGKMAHQENQAQGIESFSRRIGPISDSVTYRPGAGGTKPLCPEAKALLQKWMMGRRIYRG